eukprot:555494_1
MYSHHSHDLFTTQHYNPIILMISLLVSLQSMGRQYVSLHFVLCMINMIHHHIYLMRTTMKIIHITITYDELPPIFDAKTGEYLPSLPICPLTYDELPPIFDAKMGEYLPSSPICPLTY